MKIAELAYTRDEVAGGHKVSEPLHALFHQRARQFPERIAVSDGTQQLTYAELDSLSSQLAVKLRQQGVAPQTLVAVYLERGVQLLTCVLGILKAGGAYLPIDPTYPAHRIEYILADSRVASVACTSHNASGLPDTVRKIEVDAILQGLDKTADVSDDLPPASGVSPSDLAYVIYTSGSTGNPKGVMIQHDSVVRLLLQTDRWFGFNEFDVWSMFHSIGFDFSVWEIWGAWLFGGQLAIVPYAVSRAPASFHAWLTRTGVTVLNQTPSAFRALDLVDRAAAKLTSLRYVIFGGERLSPSLLTHWFERYGEHGPALINMYGITETTVHATYRRLTPADLQTADSPIGEPIPDLQMVLLDEQQRPVADGEPGELYVMGPGVARGYLQRPELTAERFVILTAPDSGAPARAYKTGDIALRRADGELVYVGRSDRQLKVRGFRIEPGEVERCLLEDPLLSACHVASHDYGDGDVRVVAYVVPAAAAPRDAKLDNALRKRAAARLPDYMRPSAYTVLPGLPLTSHGKIDADALPPPQQDAAPSAAQAQTPATEEQAWVLQIWREQLGLKGIGLEDDFFDFGGTSLALIRAIAMVKSHYQITLDIGALAQRATAGALAEAIRNKRN